jgi:hypothetical protein
VLQLLDRDTRRIHRLYGFTQAHRLVPGQAYGVPGKVSNTG